LGDYFILGWAIGCKAASAIIPGVKTQIITHESHDDLIIGIGGKGGGCLNSAQGSLPDGNVREALSIVTKVVAEKLK